VSDRLAFCLGVHNHQPIGNFEHVLVEATERAYRPFLERLEARPEVRVSVHCTGSLLEWLRQRAPRTFDLLGTVAARGQVELLTGGFYEPILAVLPDHDKLGQIEKLTAFLKTHFGVRPRGMWLAERVWEPHLARVLSEAGVEYVLVDDHHFALAGHDADALSGYYLTEEQGAVLRVFPINQRLRYLIPFADVDQTLAYLESRRERATAITMVDDGEKFGVWPGTYARVYEDGWLDRFFDRLLSTSWLELTTLGDVVERRPPSDRVYLPTASYGEMGEWALPVETARELAHAREAIGHLADGERLASLLRGGFWRAFLVKYPEVADTYWKMLRLSKALHAALGRRPDDAHLVRGQAALWRGQANDAYWHGVFGGCYLPHLRRAVKGALLQAERSLVDAGAAPAVLWTREDGNGDGHDEVFVRTRALAATVAPDAGGMVTELGYYPAELDLADVLTRRPEAYHDQVRARAAADALGAARTIHDAAAPKEAGLDALLAYDALRRGSLMEGFFDDGSVPIDPVAPWAEARDVIASSPLDCAVREVPDGGVSIVLSRSAAGDRPVALEKRMTIRDETLEVVYHLRPAGGARLRGRWAVQWNLTLTAGHAPDRYLDLAGRPTLGSTGREAGRSAVTMVDEWAAVEARLQWSPSAELGWGPVETVSLSEGGFERIYQGTALLLVWRLDVAPGDECHLTASLRLARR
jgi:4-alpha-glucanotransferase